MREYKEFEGKTLDEAIAEACTYYAVPRERLEIDIIQDAKTGIFGLMGTRRAKINARKVQLDGLAAPRDDSAGAGSEKAPGAEGRRAEPRQSGARQGEHLKAEPQPANVSSADVANAADDKENSPSVCEGRDSREGRDARDSRDNRDNNRRRRKSPRPTSPEAPSENSQDTPDSSNTSVAAEAGSVENADVASVKKEAASRRGARQGARNAGASASGAAAVEDRDELGEESADALPLVSLDNLDSELLTGVAMEVAEKLTRPIVGEVEYAVEISENRVRISIDCGEDFALLIGRDGQTLSALQYIASRIISRRMSATVRVQIEGGNYRERQSEKLRETAQELAAKLRETGRVQYSRPLSSYHRRILHLALQDEPDIITRSKGDGPMKRVAVMKKKH